MTVDELIGALFNLGDRAGGDGAVTISITIHGVDVPVKASISVSLPNDREFTAEGYGVNAVPNLLETATTAIEGDKS